LIYTELLGLVDKLVERRVVVGRLPLWRATIVRASIYDGVNNIIARVVFDARCTVVSQVLLRFDLVLLLLLFSVHLEQLFVHVVDVGQLKALARFDVLFA